MCVPFPFFYRERDNNTTIKEGEGVKVEVEKKRVIYFLLNTILQIIPKVWGRMGQGGCAKQTEIKKTKQGQTNCYLIKPEHKKKA